MNKEQQELLDETYVNYCMSYKDGHEFYEDEIIKRSYTKEEFINKCKTDTEFSEKWALKIEERELSQDERYDLLTQQMTKLRAIRDEDYINYNIPTKLITVTYKDKTIESYE
jgi:hypothetical protein